MKLEDLEELRDLLEEFKYSSESQLDAEMADTMIDIVVLQILKRLR